jgi:hypothetical protein
MVLTKFDKNRNTMRFALCLPTAGRRYASVLLGGRLAAGLWTLAPSTEVRILAPQPIFGNLGFFPQIKPIP